MTIVEALHENALADNDLLRKNDEKGDTFSTPRDVDFAFKTTDHGRAEALSAFINGKNFGVSSMRVDDQGTAWIIAVIHMPINQHVLCSVSGFMVCLARLFDVEYDGWGSILQPAAPLIQ